MLSIHHHAGFFKFALCFAGLFAFTASQKFISPGEPGNGLNEQLKSHFMAISPSTNLTWSYCLSHDKEGAAECAILDTPLNYEDPTGPRAAVPLLRFPAFSEKHRQGMILYNPGGPGQSAIKSLNGSIAGIRNVVGKHFDIVAWEPRGIGYSVPLINCSRTTVTKRGHAPGDSGSSFLDEAFADDKELEGACQDGPGTADANMNTGTIARDMVAILDSFAASPAARKVSGASLLNYWGFSYGTFIGQTFASMFPNRVGRVVLDGVEEPYSHVSGNQFDALTDTDDVFLTFFQYCSNAGSRCKFHGGQSPLIIWQHFREIVARLHEDRAVTYDWQSEMKNRSVTNPFLLQKMRQYMMPWLYSPIIGFEIIAQLLPVWEKVILQKDDLSISDQQGLETLLNQNGTNPLILWQAGPMCSDRNSTMYNSTLPDLRTYFTALKNQSYILGETAAYTEIMCTQWPIKGKGSYFGPFGGQTRNSILFVSNTRDPVTPLKSGQASAKLFPNSQLLTINGTGHTSLVLDNSCANQKIATFFTKGKLPGKANSCAEEPGAFHVKIEPFETSPDWQQMKKEIAELRAASILGDRWEDTYKL